MRTSGLRGLGATLPQQVMVSVPQPNGSTTQMPTAETSLANAAYQDANDYSQFVATTNAPDYATPADYMANMIEYAKELCYNSWAPYTCVGFDPVSRGTYYANQVFAALKATPYGSTNVYDYWVAHPVAQSYPTPTPQQPYNPADVPGSSVLPTVLYPPTSTVPSVTPTQIQNGTTGTQGSSADMSGVTTWLESNWQLLAAGLAALVVLPMVLGGRR